MKWILNILGGLLLLMGITWVLQGTGILPVGFMANDMNYTYAGLVLCVLAVGMIVAANWRRK